MPILGRLFASASIRRDAKRDRGLSTPDDMTMIEGIPYIIDEQQNNGLQNTLDIYYLKNTANKLPTIINVHGGGYVYGSTKQYRYYCMSLAQKGFTVVNVNYRLAPAFRFPTPLLDLNKAMNWLCNHAVGYYIDLDRIVMIGDSAGAQIVSQYAAICCNHAYSESMGLSLPKFHIRALGLHCGFYDLLNLKSLILQRFIKDYLPQHLTDEIKEQLNVLSKIRKNYPPCFIMTAPGDYLKSYSLSFAGFLTSVGIENCCKVYGNFKTGHVFHLNIRNKAAKQANQEEIEFFKEYL